MGVDGHRRLVSTRSRDAPARLDARSSARAPRRGRDATRERSRDRHRASSASRATRARVCGRGRGHHGVSVVARPFRGGKRAGRRTGDDDARRWDF